MTGHAALGPDAVIAYLGLGSSLGDRMQNLRDALRRLETIGAGLRIVAVSPVYESAHLGLNPADAQTYPPHLNCAVKIETRLSPEGLLERVRAVEDAGGRQRSERWGPRTIDVDILLYDDITLDREDLKLPHSALAERAFVLRPLADIAPDLILPDGRAVSDLLQADVVRAQRVTQVDSHELLL
ncbi:MAG TPA: 2-amino-4-hydroxy-6-hydroxymethyldihydropteridine diphosphokinase [Chthonomonadaceae bacterium]|nr:2-amino-4-hydroxy-6-hydroxymethyldihydropteridine diphosphokinase [Chthonomonadaceae bacterium]